MKIVKGSRSLKKDIRTKEQLFEYLSKFDVNGEEELLKGNKNKI